MGSAKRKRRQPKATARNRNLRSSVIRIGGPATLDALKGTSTQGPSGVSWPRTAITLLTEALKQRDRFAGREVPTGDDRRAKAYEDRVAELQALTKRRPTNAENATFAKHLRKHAAEWFLFLVDPQVPATNHRGEQALKVPIVNRKVWGGNRTEAGAKAQSVTSSVLATCQKKAVDVFQFLGNAFRGTIGKLFPQPAAVAAN